MVLEGVGSIPISRPTITMGFESLLAYHNFFKYMVDIVQLVERQIVALEVVGSSPTIHPI